MKLTSRQGRPYWFRTCDLDTDIWANGAHVVSCPKGTALTLWGGGMASAKFSLMGTAYCSQDTWLLDGINGAGLAGGLLLLEEGTSVPEAHDRAGVMGMEAVFYFLSSCANTAEVCRAASSIQITDVPTDAGTVPASMHYFFVDIQGHTVILEAADPTRPGCLQAYTDNSIGIMTNSPPYPQQLDNLRWFLSQSPELHRGGDDCPITQPAWEGVRLSGDAAAPHVSRSGILPASYAPYDRFIRLAVMKALNHDGHWIDDHKMLPLGADILQTVFEPRSRGVYHYRHTDAAGYPSGHSDGYTQYTIMYDLSRPELYLKPFDSTAWTGIALDSYPTETIRHYAVCREPMAGVTPGQLTS